MGLHQPQGAQAGRLAVAVGLVPVVQQLPAAGLDAQHVQQVVAEVAAVVAVDDHGLIARGRCLGQRVGGGQRQVEVLSRPLLGVVVEVAVVGIDMAQCRVVDGLQGHVLGLGGLLRQPLHGGLQRVTRDGLGAAGLAQRGLQQLAVGTLLPCLLLDLAQDVDFRARFVALLGSGGCLP